MDELYHAEARFDTDYPALLRPDGSVVATLGEPEDRIWERDLRGVVAELNQLRTALIEIRDFSIFMRQIHSLKTEALEEVCRLARVGLGELDG